MIGAIIDGVTYGSILLDVNLISNEIPNGYKLEQNYPNPFNPVTKISYSIKEPSFISIKVYDISGKEIALLINEMKNSGDHFVYFDGSNFASGIYYYKIEAGNFTSLRKMILLK